MIVTERQALSPDTVLFLKDKECRIIEVLGVGASSIVYKAQIALKIKGRLQVRNIVLKELYPINQGIARGIDNSLIIPNSSKENFDDDSQNFIRASKFQFEFHNYEATANYTSDIEDVFELNNTLYSVMGIVSGISYDKVEPESIVSILKVGRSIAQAVSHYHSQGYLHLDIKPANIFNLPETDELVQLFDFNTVCTRQEVLQNKFSYSDGYAAAEVKAAKKGGGKFSEIDERADVFSIGSVIFEKIMGRLPKLPDTRKGKEWKFSSNEYLQNTFPQLQKGITDLFRKTLAINKEDRFSSTVELCVFLDKLIELTYIKTFLKNIYIKPLTSNSYFISRKDEQSEIRQKLLQNGMVFIFGIGGIGKSEIAKDYAYKYKSFYNTQYLVHYEKSLKDIIAHLEFINFDDSSYSYNDLFILKLKMLSDDSQYGDKTLLIIDNFSFSNDEDVIVMEQLKKLHIHIIFTTRETPKDDATSVYIENIPYDTLRAMFFKINPFHKDEKERQEQVNRLITLVSGHTMTIDLVAKQTKALEQYVKRSLSDVITTLSDYGLNNQFNEKVYNNKDSDIITNNQDKAVYGHIKALFSFADLNSKQRYILKNACMLPLEGFSTKEFCEFIDLSNYDDSEKSPYIEDKDLTFLVNTGWIIRSGKYQNEITIHPVIADVIFNELGPRIYHLHDTIAELSFYDCDKLWFSLNNKYNEVFDEKSQLRKYVSFLASATKMLYFKNKKKGEVIFLDNLRLPFITGNSYYLLGEYKTAIRYYEGLLENSDCFRCIKINALMKLTKIYDFLGEQVNAIKYAKMCIDRSDKDIDIVFSAAYEAKDDFHLAAFLNSKDLDEYSNYGDELQKLCYTAGTAFLHAGQYLPALDCFFESLEIYFMPGFLYSNSRYKKERGLYLISGEIGNITVDIALCYEKLGYTRIAAELYVKALGYYDQLEYRNLHKTALIWEFFGEYQTALEAEKEHLKILLERFPESHPDIAYTYYWLGHLYYMFEDDEQALNMFDTAINRYEKYFSSDYPVLGEIYEAKGTLYFHQKKLDDCLEYYHKAISIYTKYSTYSKNTSNLFRKMARAYRLNNESSSAFENISKAMNMYRSLEKEERTDLMRMYLYNDMTNILIQMKSYKQAYYFALRDLSYYYRISRNSMWSTSFSFMVSLKKLNYINKKKRNANVDESEYNNAVNISTFTEYIYKSLIDDEVKEKKAIFIRLSKIYYHLGKPLKALNALFFSNKLVRKWVMWANEFRYYHNLDKVDKFEDNNDFETELLYLKKNLKIAKRTRGYRSLLGRAYSQLEHYYYKIGNKKIQQKYKKLEDSFYHSYPHYYELERDDLWADL